MSAWNIARKASVCGWALWAAVAFAPAQDAETTARLRKVVAGARAAKGKVGAQVIRLEDGATLFSDEADLPLVPASNEKVLTCVAAALALGFEAEIKTEFIAQGAFKDGVVSGPLRVRGEGDPTFGAKDFGETLEAFKAAAARLVAKGLKRVAGDVVVDDSAFDRTLVGPDWPPDAPTDSWMAGSAALAVDEGTARIVVRPGRAPGAEPEVSVTPDVGYVRLTNRLGTTDRKKDAAVGFERRGPGELVAKGAVRAGAGAIMFDVAVDDPALHFGYAVKHALGDAGIKVDGVVRRATDEERKGGEILLTFRTPLSRIFPRLLKHSQNHRAEMVFRHLGYKTTGLGSHENAARAVEKTLGEAGVPVAGVSVADGCGLSRKNRATAAALAGALAAIGRRPEGAAFREMLAEPGEEGTLERRLPDLKDRFFGKTGYVEGVWTLSGFLATRDGKWLVFAILINGPGGGSLRRYADDFAEALGKG